MIKDITEVNFPTYATISQATISQQDMAEKTITTQIKIDGDISPDFSFDWQILYQGEKYIMPLRKPQGSKENTSLSSKIDLTFQHWAVYNLKRYPFVTMQPIDSGTAVEDEEEASVSLNLKDFCDAFALVLNYYYGDAITIDLNPEWEYEKEPTTVSISHSYVWEVLAQVYKLYGARWQIEANGTPDKYVIRVGYATTEISHVFQYGFEGGLMKVERQVQSEEIRNMIKGRGGDTNLPYRYFKDIDTENPDFSADPDWVPELKNIYFKSLRGATFRSYIQGWKAKHYNGKVTKAEAYAPWAWERGYTDEKFHPVEYVKDDDSIAKYGELMTTLDANEDIYPTIQGVVIEGLGRVDEAVMVQQMLSDDLVDAAKKQVIQTTFENPPSVTIPFDNEETKDIVLQSEVFTIPEGMYANLDEGKKTVKVIVEGISEEVVTLAKNLGTTAQDIVLTVGDYYLVFEDTRLTVVDTTTGEERSPSGIPSGEYFFRIKATIHNTATSRFNVTLSCETPMLTIAHVTTKEWNGTFDIWIKNVWQTEKGENETDVQYSERVWKPILGDRVGNEAAVMFTTGNLSYSEDYEFVITQYPEYDTSQEILTTDKDGSEIMVSSHWRLTLGKSDADLESTGLYVPSTKRQGNPGDHFLFIGTDMTHWYTVQAEIALDEYKNDKLLEVSDINPTWVVGLDRIKVNTEIVANPSVIKTLLLEDDTNLLTEGGFDFLEETSGTSTLAYLLRPGNVVTLFDKRFIEGVHQEKLYIQSVTYTYREPSSDDNGLNPDVEIVLSDKYDTETDTISTISGEVEALHQKVGTISNVINTVRKVGDKVYLRKDGFEDTSYSPTRFASLVASDNFRSGIVGGAGWGFTRDESNNTILEIDKINVRQDFKVNNFVINQVKGSGGMIVETAAYMEVTRVIEQSDGYVCYFDQHDGSVANLFQVGDVAFCNRYTPENNSQKFYKRRVTAVGVDNITLTKALDENTRPITWADSGCNGTGVPGEGDSIIQYGSYTDAARRYVKVRDVVGGGYEEYIEGLDSVTAEGSVYYSVGRKTGAYNNKPHFYLGDSTSYIEYANNTLNVKATISAESAVGDKTLEEYVKEPSAEFDYLRTALQESTTISGGLMLTSQISLGYTNNGVRYTMAGVNGATSSLRAISFFSGGDMIDGASETLTDAQQQRAATFLVRMDGTGYFANGNIRFEQNCIMVGDNIRLDVDGLAMLNESGTKLTITNDSVGDIVAADTSSQVPIAVSVNETCPCVWKDNELIFRSHTISAQNINTENITKGDKIEITAKILMTYTAKGNVLPETYSGADFKLKFGSTILATEHVYFEVISDVELRAVCTFSLVAPSTGVYSCEISIFGNDAISGTEENASAGVSISGYYTHGEYNIIKIGNDGVLIAMNETRNYTSPQGISFMSGNNGLLITPTSLKKIKNGNEIDL